MPAITAMRSTFTLLVASSAGLASDGEALLLAIADFNSVSAALGIRCVPRVWQEDGRAGPGAAATEALARALLECDVVVLLVGPRISLAVAQAVTGGAGAPAFWVWQSARGGARAVADGVDANSLGRAVATYRNPRELQAQFMQQLTRHGEGLRRPPASPTSPARPVEAQPPPTAPTAGAPGLGGRWGWLLPDRQSQRAGSPVQRPPGQRAKPPAPGGLDELLGGAAPLTPSPRSAGQGQGQGQGAGLPAFESRRGDLPLPGAPDLDALFELDPPGAGPRPGAPQAAGAAPPDGVPAVPTLPGQPGGPSDAVAPASAGPASAVDSAPPALPATLPPSSPSTARPLPPEVPPVDASVFCPPQVARTSVFLVQVYLYPPPDAAAVAAEAQRHDPAAQAMANYSLPLDVPPGTRVALRLEMPTLQVDEPDALLVWRGVATSAQFEVTVPAVLAADAVTPASEAMGRVRVAVDGVPVGTMRFKLQLLPAGSSVQPAAATATEAQRYRRAFVSYSSKDRAEVLRRVQAFKIAGITVFQDILSLDPGERWAQALYREIDRCDVFLLFWSHAAAASEWVAKEIDYALARQGGDLDQPPAIQPVPIEGPPIVPPPPSLSALHFNDALLAQIAAASVAPPSAAAVTGRPAG